MILAMAVGLLAMQYAQIHNVFAVFQYDESAANNIASPAQSAAHVFVICDGKSRLACVVDGDTIWHNGVKIRPPDIDAPEIHDFKCASELALAQRTKERLLELMNAGPFEVVADGDRDKDVYGRQLRHINRNGQSLGDILIAEGLAAAWEGQHHAWC